MLWKLNMDVVNDIDQTGRRSMENDHNLENILDTSVMIDPRKSHHYKYRPDDFEIED